MKKVRIFGAIMILIAGYLTNFFIHGGASLRANFVLGSVIFVLVAIGMAAILSSNTKTFLQHLRDIIVGAISSA